MGFGAVGEALAFPLHSLAPLEEGEAWVSLIPPFLCLPLGLGGWVVHLSFIKFSHSSSPAGLIRAEWC